MSLVGVFVYNGIRVEKAYATAPMRLTKTQAVVDGAAILEWVLPGAKITPALKGRRYRRRPSLWPVMPEQWREVGARLRPWVGWRLVRVIDDARE